MSLPQRGVPWPLSLEGLLPPNLPLVAPVQALRLFHFLTCAAAFWNAYIRCLLLHPLPYLPKCKICKHRDVTPRVLGHIPSISGSAWHRVSAQWAFVRSANELCNSITLALCNKVPVVTALLMSIAFYYSTRSWVIKISLIKTLWKIQPMCWADIAGRITKAIFETRFVIRTGISLSLSN